MQPLDLGITCQRHDSLNKSHTTEIIPLRGQFFATRVIKRSISG